MFKKSLILGLAALAATQVNAFDLLNSEITPSCWNASYEASTHTITYESGQWGGCSWWLGGDDYSQYSSIEVVLAEPSTVSLSVVANYSSDGSDSGSQSFPAGTTTLTLDLDKQKSQALYGMYISNNEAVEGGVEVKLASIDIKAASTPPTPATSTSVTVWSGSTELGNWAEFVFVEADKFSSVKAGDVVKINISELSTESEYHQIILKTSAENWPTLTGCDYETIAATGEFSLNITEAIAQELKATGLIVAGCYVTLSEISVVSTEAQGTQTTSVTVWNGGTELGNWAEFVFVEADKFSSVKTGDVVKINISELSTESEYHQIILKTSAENWPTLTGCDYETIAATGEFSLNVTDAIAQELKATGLIVAGCYVTISEISIESTSGTEPGGNTPSQTQTFQWSAEAMALDILENGASNKANIEISMSNLKPAIGFQCDITVPEAIISAIGAPTWASRSLDSHVISYSTLANGDIRIVAFSNSNEAFTGESGVLFCLPFNSANLTAGVYTIKIHNIRMVEEGNTEVNVEDITSTVALKYAQTITWDCPESMDLKTSITLNATSSRGLEVSYQIVSGSEYATLNGNTLTAVAEGDVVVKASQAGNDEVSAAEDVVKTITIINPIIYGDANDDGNVTVADVTTTVNYILEKNPEPFNFEAADMNENGEISVVDVTLIVKEVMAMAASTTPRVRAHSSFTEEYHLSVTETGLQASLTNAQKYVATQFDLELPFGVEVTNVVVDGNHTASFANLGNNAARVVVYSLGNSSFEDGNINIELNNIAEGSYTLHSALINATVGENVLEFAAEGSASHTTGLSLTHMDQQNATYYNLNGIQVSPENLSAGIYIRVCGDQTQKVLIK